MNDIRNILKKIFQWVNTDGLLHFLTCYALILTFFSIFNLQIGILLTIVIAILKEVYDIYIKKCNNYKQALHDIVMDIIGVIMGVIIIII